MRRNLYVGLLGLMLAAAACSDDTPYQATTEPGDDAGTNNGEADTSIEDEEPEPDPDMGTNNGAPDLPIIEPDGGDFEPACSLEDGLAPNQDADSAAEVEADLIEQFFLCADTSDWYVFDAQEGQTIVLWTNFDPNFGDIDIYVYADGATGSDQQVAESTSQNQAEYIEYDVPATGRYYLEVRSFQGTENAYTQVIKVQCQSDADCGDGSTCHLRNRWCYAEDRELTCGVDEGYEPNESTGTATPLDITDDAIELSGLGICPEDEDYYRIEIGAEQGLSAVLLHGNETDIDLLLFKESGEFVSFGARRRTGKEMRAPFLAAGTYILLVDMQNFQGATPTTYDLEVTLEEGRCEADQDCSGVNGREFCDVETGVCFGIESDGGQGLFEPCDDDQDCSPDTEGCYEGTPGSGDNLCTIVCSSAADTCDDIEDNAYCQIIDRLADFGICTPACSSDFDCSANLFCDTEVGRCESRGCVVDGDCTRDGEACVYSDFEYQGGRCLPFTEPELDCGVGEAPDNGTNGSSTTAAALTFEGNSAFIENLSTCDGDEDWYVVELTGDASNLTVDVGFEGRADLDVYLFSEDGRGYGQGVEPDANPEQVVSQYMPAGRYFLRVNHFPVENGDDTIGYNIQINLGEADCRNLDTACDDTTPLRIVCDEDTGACADFEGNGEVEIGGTCDSLDDCTEDADVCFTFLGAGDDRNICTHTCTSQQECGDVPGTRCQPIRRGLGICIEGGR
jgi:hypothetical protein